MKRLKIDKKTKLIILIVILSILVISYVGLIAYNIHSLKRYNTEILPNTYIDEFDMSYYSYKTSSDKIDSYSDYVLSKEIKLNINSKDYNYTLKDLGIVIDNEKTIKQIEDYQKKLSYSRKLMISNGRYKKTFSFVYKIDENKLTETIKKLKTDSDVAAVKGHFETATGVSYKKGVPGYAMDLEKSIEIIKKSLLDGAKENKKIELVGNVVGTETDESYSKIDTMTSSYVTDFMPNTYLRNINLNTALSYINGTIVQPGGTFSYCDKAGPFDKAGYVFYYEFVGNGVCQIATTTYNAALLGGLEIVKRYPHAKKSVYVPGGLDATVASYSSGWCVDMQFKNTYEYPIYIKAYSEGGRAHVEFWSNKDAKKGYTYSTSSTKIGVRGYKSYLHTWKDGKEVSVKEIATTWYTEE